MYKRQVYGKDGKQKAKYVGGTSNELKIDASLLDTNLANSAINKGTITGNVGVDDGRASGICQPPAEVHALFGADLLDVYKRQRLCR